MIFLLLELCDMTYLLRGGLGEFTYLAHPYMPLFIKTDLKFLAVVKVGTSLLEMMFRLRGCNWL